MERDVRDYDYCDHCGEDLPPEGFCACPGGQREQQLELAARAKLTAMGDASRVVRPLGTSRRAQTLADSFRETYVRQMQEQLNNSSVLLRHITDSNSR